MSRCWRGEASDLLFVRWVGSSEGCDENISVDITFSIVGVTFETPATPENMIEIVERQMGLVKGAGKNRVSYHVHA